MQPAVVYRFDPADGSLKAMTDPDEVVGPNGLAFSPDESLLYVVDTAAPEGLFGAPVEHDAPKPDRLIHVFDVEDGGQQISGRRDFYRVTNGNADGIRVDSDGNIWSSAGNGVHCIASDGTLLGRIATPVWLGTSVSVASTAIVCSSAAGMRCIPSMCTRVGSSTLHFLERRYNEDSRSVSMPLDRHPIALRMPISR